MGEAAGKDLERKRSKGRNKSSKSTFSHLFFSDATTVLVTATQNLHHPTPALSLRKPTTNFTEIPVGLRVRGAGCMFEAVIWKLKLALSKQARQGQGHTPGRIRRSSAFPQCSSMPAFRDPSTVYLCLPMQS